MRSTLRKRTRSALVAIGLVTALAALTGCTGSEPTPTAWSLVAKGDIIAIDSTSGVYVSGQSLYGSGSTSSHGVIDYQYARRLTNGAIRQDLVSTTYERFGGTYPGSQAVTLYEDAAANGTGARIEIYKCLTRFIGQCPMPGGGAADSGTLRVDIHIPPGSVVKPFDATTMTAPTPTPTPSKG